MRERGHPIPVKGWWLRLARSVVQGDTRDLEQLGRDLAKHVKAKKQPFSYSSLSAFLLGKQPATIELVEALCKEYSRLPPPVFFPGSYEECAQMIVIAERYASQAMEYEFDAEVVPIPVGKERRPRRGKLAQYDVSAAGTTSRAAEVGAAKRRRAR